MTETAPLTETTPQQTEPFDVIIVGAGISGVGGAYHLTKQCPGTSFVVLETQESYGGTWLTHRYPGIRSDSDLYTFGYRFKPWTSAPIATAAEILSYMGEVIDENDLGPHIRYRHQIVSARWSSSENRWTIAATRTDTGETVRLAANFLWMCQGYYRHAQGYTPDWRRDGDLQGSDRSPAVMAGGPGLRRQDCRRHRLGRHRGDAHSGDRGRLRPCHDAATFADLVQDGAQCDRARRRVA